MTAPIEPAAAASRAFCTYFDSNYLSRGIVMIGTLLTHNPAAVVYVLCLDETAEKVLNLWFKSRVATISLRRLHQFDPRLAELRTKRSTWEFYATHKPAFLHFLMSECGPFQWVSFIDADTAFYGSIAPVFDEIAAASVGLSPHRFQSSDDSRKMFGLYNAGFVCVHDDPVGRQCLRDWREDCINWCHELVLADGRYMNQGYLSRWPERYPNVAIIRHPGANLAPWNIRSHRIEIVNGAALVDGYPLIFYHFSALVRDDDGNWRSHHASDLDLVPELRANLYGPYVAEVDRVRNQLLSGVGLSGTGSVRPETAAT